MCCEGLSGVLRVRVEVRNTELTWYCEVLSVYDVIFKHIIVLLLTVTVEILQVWHHCHAPPGVMGFSAGRDGDGLF